jgi:hypothetical protein
VGAHHQLQIHELSQCDDEHDAVNGVFPDRTVKRFDILDFVQRQERRNSDRLARSQGAC